MKQTVTFLTFIFASLVAFSQAPNAMSYQAVIRDANNNLVSNQSVGMQISILQGSANGSSVYTEIQTASTNDNGLVSIAIGEGTTNDDFSSIDWANGPYFIKTETDPTGGSNYTITGTSQLLSVPFALHAKTVGSPFSGDYNDLSNTPTTLVIPKNTSDLTNDSGYLTNPNDADADATNELQNLSLSQSRDTLYLSSGNWIIIRGSTIYCSGTSTTVVDVTNPTTGKIWMDRNLGAFQVATSSNDAAAYGDLYQWGRGNDGHQCRNSNITNTLSTIDKPGHSDFILNSNDWLSQQNVNLWQGVYGWNNPCPSGYRLPTDTEFDAERLSWFQSQEAGAFASPLKLTMPSLRNSDGSFNIYGAYWTSTVDGTSSRSLRFLGSPGMRANAYIKTVSRGNGLSVRCIKHQ